MIHEVYNPEKYKARGCILRKSLSVSDNSILKPRNFRNHFEHFDERLEDWASLPRRVFIDRNIGPGESSGIQVQALTPESYLRNFDNSNLAVTFQGDSYTLKPIVVELKRLQQKAKEEAHKNSAGS